MTKNQKEKIVDLLKLYECFGIKYIEPLNLSNQNIKTSQVLPKSYESLNEYINHCNLCELSKSCEKKLGLHDPKSNIYIVDINCDFYEISIQKKLNYFIKQYN